MDGGSPSSPTVVEDRSDGVETAPAAAAASSGHRLPRGSLLDRYIVLDPVAEGGMGAVYRAYDPRLHREVALKLLKVESDDPDALRSARARLVREAQSMAQLSHPNVLPVFDVGSVGDRLFIAMEFVDGDNLRGWLREDARTWREIVAVFREAGRGLAAAHAGGVVHRDFKPGNVLLDRSTPPRVRVTDFGLARLASGAADTDQTEPSSPRALSASALATPLTQHGVVVGTPPYMAPEQHRRSVADGRCDQYAFAVALWEALFGIRPFMANKLERLLALKLEGAPTPPKGRTVPAFVLRALRRALAPEPSDRFESMETMVEALGGGAARSSTTWTAAVVGAVAVAGVTWGATRLYASSEDLCSAGDDDLAGVWSDDRRQAVGDAFGRSGVPYAADAWSRAEVGLDAFAQQWVTAHREACEATHVRHEQSSLLLDRKMHCLSRRFSRFSALVDLFEEGDPQVVWRAADAVGQLPELDVCADAEAMLSGIKPPEDIDVAREVRVQQKRLDRARAFHAGGLYDDALRVSREAASVAREIGYEPLQAEAQAVVGLSAMRAGDHSRAREALEDAYFLAGSVGDHATAVHAADTLIGLAGMRGASDDARAWGRHAQMQLRVLGHRPDVEARLLSALTIADVIDEKYEEGYAKLERALELADGVLGPETAELASFNNQAAIFLEHLGRMDEAGVFIRRALEYREAAVGERHPDVANILINYGAYLWRIEDKEGAYAAMERAARIHEEGGTPDHPSRALALRNLGTFAAADGDQDRALRHFEESLQILRAARGPNHPDVADSLHNLGVAALDADRPKECVAPMREAVEILERAFGMKDVRTADQILSLASCERSAGDTEAATADTERALAVLDAAIAEDASVLDRAREIVEDARDDGPAEPFDRWLRGR